MPIYHSAGGTPEVWVEETGWISQKIVDSLTGRTRICTITLADPRNIKASTYTPYLRIKVTEKTSGTTNFLGRVDFTEPSYDERYGQILKVTASDYIRELFERKVSTDYSGTPRKRSALIRQIVTDYTYPGSLTFSVSPSGSSDLVARNFTNSGLTPIQIIEQLAEEDWWNDAHTGCGYDYYVDDAQVFHYFMRNSRPAGGPTLYGLTVELNATETESKRCMLADYSFCDDPRELITRVTCQGTAIDGTFVTYTASNPGLEAYLGIVKEKIDYNWGADMSVAILTTYLTNRAEALLSYQQDSIIRGTFSIYRYPYFGPSKTFVRVGDKIEVIIAPKSIHTEFLVIEVSYEEPPGITTIQCIGSSGDLGRSFSPFDTTSVLEGLKSGQDISVASARINDLVVGTAKIGNLSVTDAKIASCSITKLTAGDLSVTGTIISGGRFVTDSSPNPRIEINAAEIAGYSDATTRQFYLKAIDGTAEAGGGHVVLDANGITIWGLNNALTTRATRTGTPQCYVGSDGKLYAGGGKVVLDATGLTIDTTSAGAFFTLISGFIATHIYFDGTYISFPSLIKSVGIVPDTSTCDIGSTGAAWRSIYVTKAYHSSRLQLPVGTNRYG